MKVSHRVLSYKANENNKIRHIADNVVNFTKRKHILIKSERTSPDVRNRFGDLWDNKTKIKRVINFLLEIDNSDHESSRYKSKISGIAIIMGNNPIQS